MRPDLILSFASEMSLTGAAALETSCGGDHISRLSALALKTGLLLLVFYADLYILGYPSFCHAHLEVCKLPWLPSRSGGEMAMFAPHCCSSLTPCIR